MIHIKQHELSYLPQIKAIREMFKFITKIKQIGKQ